jgi:dTDP-4-dehydrorhamnose 3,5-epimerase
VKIVKTKLDGVLVIEPDVYGDDRGFFLESWNQEKFNEAVGFKVNFVQDNHSKSQKGILRGLHFQSKNVQSKLVRVVNGAVFDVVVDLRKNSSTYGDWFGIEISALNKKQLWIPKGIAHGFLSLESDTEFLYKCDAYYSPEFEYSLSWNDKEINIDWPDLSTSELPVLSNKDMEGLSFKEIKCLELEL